MRSEQNIPRAAVSRICNAALERASLEHGFTIEAILSPSRAYALVEARQTAMLYARDEGISLEDIGYHMGRHHSTIHHGLKRAEERRERIFNNPAHKVLQFKSSRV